MYDVITIGSATIDAFLISKAFKVLPDPRQKDTDLECVPFGSKIELDNMVLTTGGGATNAAATFANLGFKASVVTRIGDDAPGRDVLTDLKKYNVDTKLVKTVKRGVTGYGTQLMVPTGERSVLVYRGVSNDFSEKDITWSKMKTKWIYMTSLAGNTSLALKIVKNAAKKKINVAYNPGSGELKKGVKAFEPIMRHLSILNVNLEEAAMLAGSKTRDVKSLVKKLMRPGLNLIITDGPRGAYLANEDGIVFARTRTVKVISRTGAGDAFGSGTVSALMKGLPIDDALRVGTINAESVIGSYGAKFGILEKWPSAAIMKQVKVRNM